MSAFFAQRVVVGKADEHGAGVIRVVDGCLKPGDLVEVEVHPVRVHEATGPLLKQTRVLALDLPSDYSTNFETRQ